ncbi:MULTISPECIES: hypothetical protein [unclassified Pseudomonas]|uniref:hypothetical protein n=1 Tax=unclassified Pseudomonas TaxID=196821 RepID=UPI0004D47EE1|nr:MULTISPECIES: hypothetical protein [unclassified Pseudomonas]KSW22805.1 hypothetical protein AOX63_05150 [Pseudomonas sp. ADP]KES23132.1 hypothetical protein FG99_16390 [Pseudomonas sp. AAC]KSW28425.1 hypothetical protein AOX63_00020 [Pseudomonas sp. ADP]OBP13095.1 hypothetical protein BAE52_01060 [Pseudomonas sp. EGD-AKN5]QOF85625.1 hypothetical protein IG194_02640 [Pseudomonas sp. ADPe]
MRTLGAIIEAARAGEKPTVDELRYAVCALDILMTFDRNALFKLAEAEQEGKKPVLVYSPTWQRDESFNRVKRAMEKSPKDYLGPNYNPDSTEVQQRRRAAARLYEKAIQRRVPEGGGHA